MMVYQFWQILITPDGTYHPQIIILGIIFYSRSNSINKGVGRETPVGGLWSSVMIFTIVVTFMGIQFVTIFFSAIIFS